MALQFKAGKGTPMKSFRTLLPEIYAALFLLTFSVASFAQTPSSALLILEKSDNSLIIVDPTTLKITGRVPAGPDPHEVIASTDGKFAFVSNYGGLQSTFHSISVIDLVAQKALPPIDLGALSGTHGLDFAAGKLYFTAEPDKAIGRVDPATMKVDWILGIGQNRTHMITVSKDASRIFTSNVNSDSIGIVEQTAVAPMGPPPGGPGGNPPPATNGNPPPPPANPKDWNVTVIPVGKGPEGFDISPDGKELWAANSHEGTISVIDLASKKSGCDHFRAFPNGQSPQVHARRKTRPRLGPRHWRLHRSRCFHSQRDKTPQARPRRRRDSSRA
jgi:DNA-binding beta-propeller fold protein YncE